MSNMYMYMCVYVFTYIHTHKKKLQWDLLFSQQNFVSSFFFFTFLAQTKGSNNFPCSFRFFFSRVLLQKPLLSYWPGMSKGFLKYEAISVAFSYSQEVEGKSLLQKTPHTSETRAQSYLSRN